MDINPKLFIPGPTHVPSDVMEALSQPQIGHRTPEISELINHLVLGIQKVLYTNVLNSWIFFFFWKQY